MLLNRLFRFLDSDSTNEVLAGYFSKLVHLLVNRKQNQFVPYVFNNGVFDLLLKHLNQRSICEVIIKLMNTNESNFGHEFACEMKEAKTKVIQQLLSALNTEDHETSLNISLVMCELIEVSDFFNTIARRQNI